MTGLSFADKRVLLVEDQRPFLVVLKGLLHSLGCHHVKTCMSAEQAINLCKENAFDMVISDLHLGNKRKNGFELVEELRATGLLKPHQVFLIISADSARPIVIGSIERRPDDFLVKPFSQAQLKSRLIRAWHKRQFLAPIFVASEKGALEQAISVALHLLKTPKDYARQCLQLLVELYWRAEQPANALALLESDKRGMKSTWSQIAVTKSLIALGRYQEAASNAEHLIVTNRFCVEAYDLLAQAQAELAKSTDALETIRQAIQISSYSIKRHKIASRIARVNNDYELASDSQLAIWEQSKRSIHQSPALWAAYIRSLLDVAQNTSDRNTKNRYQQEAILAVQRGRQDEIIKRFPDSFNYDLFESLTQARISAIDGKAGESKRALNSIQSKFEQEYGDIPPVYLPDSVITLFQIGEYEQGQELLEKHASQMEELDDTSLEAIETANKDTEKLRDKYTRLNKEGIEFYQIGKFNEAKERFEEAQSIAPVNLSVALNLLQCIAKALTQGVRDKQSKSIMFDECRQIYRLLSNSTLEEHHEQKLSSINNELAPFRKQINI